MTRSDPQSDDAPGVDPEIPGSMADAILDNEATLRRLLAELQEARLVGDAEGVREELRRLSEANTFLFKSMMVTLRGHGTFFADVDRVRSEDGVSTLAEFHDEFGNLAENLEIVSIELDSPVKNPFPSVTTSPDVDSERGIPLMRCELNSGDVALAEFVVPPSHALRLAGEVVYHAGYVIRDFPDGDAIDDAEHERILQALDTIDGGLEAARTCVDDMVTKTSISGSEPTAGLRYFQ